VDAAARDRILVAVEGRPGRFAFVHAVIRRVLIEDMPAAPRATWHARIATTLERLAGERTDAIAAELVRHFAASGTSTGLRRAFTYACRGAEQAARELGWEEATRLYEVALDVGGRCGALDDVRAIELRLALAHAQRQAGDVAGARARCQEVALACQSIPRPDLLGRAALLHAGPVPEFGRLDPETRAILEAACREGDRIDDAPRAQLYARLAADIFATNDLEQMPRAAALSDEAASAARRVGDAGALARALFARLYSGQFGLWARSVETETGADAAARGLQDLIRLAESADDPELAAQVRYSRASVMFTLGRAEQFWADADALVTVATSSRVPEARWLADLLSALRATVEGRFAEARRLMDEALTIGTRMQLTNAVGFHIIQEVMWYALQGRIGELLPRLTAFVDEHPSGALLWPVRAIARLARGDEASARARVPDARQRERDVARTGLLAFPSRGARRALRHDTRS
jgi:hypothetical protein